MEDLEKVALRLRAGDKDALAEYFHPKGYNLVIRQLVSAMVDKIRSAGATAGIEVGDVEIAELEGDG